MSIGSFARGCACFALLSTAMPSFAASPVTDGFIADTRLRAVFVTQASGLAADRAASPTLRDFAAAEAQRQVALLAAVERDPATAPHDRVADLGEPGSGGSSTGGTRTGRSVGTDGMMDARVVSPPPGLGAQMPAATLCLDRLAALRGSAFDTLYMSLMHSVLADEVALFAAYGKTGDDGYVRSVAARELPRLTESLASID